MTDLDWTDIHLVVRSDDRHLVTALHLRHGALRDQDRPSLVLVTARTRANWPGLNRLLGLGNSAATRMVPVFVIDLAIDKMKLSFVRIHLLPA